MPDMTPAVSYSIPEANSATTGSASLAAQMTPSLCSNVSLAVAMNCCTVQNRKLGEDLGGYVSENEEYLMHHQ